MVYNFWRGHPNTGLLPAREMQEILQTMASRENQERLTTSLQYLKSDRGDPFLLKELSLFLRRHTLDDELPLENHAEEQRDEDMDMFLTHGVSHGLDMLCTAQTTEGDVVLVERPCYFLAAGIFRSHGLEVKSLPMKQRGGAPVVDVGALERGLRDGSIGVPRMIYVVPTHQNPTGITMPLDDRWRLCRLAREFGILVAADEVYHLLDWREDRRTRPSRFSVLDRLASSQPSLLPASDGAKKINRKTMGCSVSVSSFTKIFTPGVRCGWIEGPTEIIDSIADLGYIQSQGGCAPFVGNVLRTALEGGLQDRILAGLNASYQERCETLCDVLDSEPGIRIACRPAGGYFVWVDFLDLPRTEDETGAGEPPSSAFASHCLRHGLRFMPGVRCDPVVDGFQQSGQPKDLCESSARLCFADMDLHDVSDGAKLLVRLYREYVAKQDNRAN